MTQETVIFDLGGVVFNWQPRQLMREVFPHRVQDEAQAHTLYTEIFQSHETDGDWAQWDLGLIEPREMAQRIAGRLNMSASEIERLVHAIPGHLAVKTDTVALIESLKAQGHRLLYLSNMPQELALWIEQEHPFDHWFEAGVFSARVQQAKPDDGIYHRANEQLGLHGVSPIFIDDMPRNVQTAQRLGWRAIRFESAEQVRQDLGAHGVLLD
jgi:HAD superfamily hydrolase (TIGR01509 family)